MQTEEFLRLLLQLFLLLLDEGVNSLRLQKVVIPPYKLRGDNAILECHYQLDGDTLYAVKWYKENEEFYRYVPKSSPPQYSYKVEGVRVDHGVSNSHRVVLKGVNLGTSGVYRCEVSAEAPSFSSAQREGRMEVVFLPKDGPHISGEKKEYQIGDIINLNCSSGKSYPSSVLHWFINDKQVSDSALQRYPAQKHPHGLVTSHLGLQMTLSTDHFIDGILRVKCVAKLSPQLWQNNRESVLQKIDNREAMLLVKGYGCRIEHSILILIVLQLFLIVSRRLL